MTLEAFLLPTAPDGPHELLALWHAPAAPQRGAALYVHPFAEEMNKTRRMAALQARALAAAGWGVLQIDLRGCGDSSGDFGDFAWSDWVTDVHTGLDWLHQRFSGPLTLWGLRAGGLLLAEAARQRPDTRFDFVFWQPAAAGSAVLRQFLRQAAAAAALDGGSKGVVEGLRRELAAGRSVHVGGYRLHPNLASGLDAATLQPPATAGRVLWLDVGTAPALPATLHPASAAAAEAWRAAALSFHGQTVPGPAFWQTAEIEESPALLAATWAGVTTP